MTEKDRIKIYQFANGYRKHSFLVEHSFSFMVFGHEHGGIITVGKDKDEDSNMNSYVKFGNKKVYNYFTIGEFLDVLMRDQENFNDCEECKHCKEKNDRPDSKIKLPTNCS